MENPVKGANTGQEDGHPTGLMPKPQPQSGVGRDLFALVVCFLSGIVFGFCMEKGRVFEPASIRLQMVFERWIMLKMFLAAMAAGMFCLSLMSIIPVDFVREKFHGVFKGYETGVVEKNALAVAIGGFILGIGMTLSGACPGMVLPQVGAWARNAIFTLLGSLLGALLYGLVHDVAYDKIFPKKSLVLPTTLMKLAGLKYAYIGLPMSLAVFGVVIGMEVGIPWKNEVVSYALRPNYSAPNVFQEVAWPPAVAGAIIGLLQVVLVLGAGHTLGSSTSYMTVMAQFFCTDSSRKTFPFMAKYRGGLGKWWQVTYVTGGIIGGVISSALSGTIAMVPGVPVAFAVLGGMLLLFGARVASGCTSGHGLSGAGMLFLASFVAVPAMFAGGIATGFILKVVGELHHLLP